jgi:hypothetical protein
MSKKFTRYLRLWEKKYKSITAGDYPFTPALTVFQVKEVVERFDKLAVQHALRKVRRYALQAEIE